MSGAPRRRACSVAADLVLVLSAPLAAAAPFATGAGWSASLLGGTCAWLYLASFRHGSRPRVVGVLLGWAFCLSLATILLTCAAPERAGMLIPRAGAYWAEMKPWLMTGVGKESMPAAFVPEHILHAAAFALLALVSGGWAALVLGALLMGYMSFYVGQVVLLSEHPFVAGVLAWHPWALMRVAAFVILGVSLARVLLDREGISRWWQAERRPLTVAALLWVGDLALKSVLAGPWSGLIRSLAGIR